MMSESSQTSGHTMNGPKSHHYVPVVYQNRFVNERGLLWVYDRARKQYGERHPKVICCEKDLYAVKPKDAPKDQRLESIALAQVDGDCATGVRTLLFPFPGMPGRHVLSVIAYFVGLQYSRVPSMREFVSKLWERSYREMMRLTAVAEGRMQGLIDRYEHDTGDTIEVTAKVMVQTIKRGGLKVIVTEAPFLRNVFDTARIVADTVIHASWQVLRAPPETGFILCDEPVVVVPPRGCRQVGVGVPGTAIYIPLSRDACLRLTNASGPRLVYRDIDTNAVELINQNIAANSIRFVMCKSDRELEAIVSRSGCAEPYATPRVTFQKHSETDEGSLEVATVNPRDYFYLPSGLAP